MPTTKPDHRRCRSITVSGRQCHQRALRDQDLCVAHAKYRYPVCPKGAKVAVPLLEDLATIQVLATQVAQGLLAETIDPWRAGKILYACQVAALTLPRPARIKPLEEKPLVEVPVEEVFTGPAGEPLGPERPWIPQTGVFNPIWNYSKRLYMEECERLNKPKPVSPDDFPISGWLSPEETEEYEKCKRPWEFSEGFLERMLHMRVEADRFGKLPPLRERGCPYGNSAHCDGPSAPRRCEFCGREREEHLRLPPPESADAESPDAAPGLDASAEPSLDLIGLDDEPLNLNASAGENKHCHPERSRVATESKDLHFKCCHPERSRVATESKDLHFKTSVSPTAGLAGVDNPVTPANANIPNAHPSRQLPRGAAHPRHPAIRNALH